MPEGRPCNDSVTLSEKRAEEDRTQPELQEASVDTGPASEYGGGRGRGPEWAWITAIITVSVLSPQPALAGETKAKREESQVV